MPNAGQLLHRVPIRQHVVPQQPQGGEFRLTRPVFKLHTGFDRTIIATAHDLAHAGRVAATAHIFEQECVIEVGQRCG